MNGPAGSVSDGDHGAAIRNPGLQLINRIVTDTSVVTTGKNDGVVFTEICSLKAGGIDHGNGTGWVR